ncbi:thermonuclease family protein [Sabulicella glaciei]|uniref:Thermonuclease family protein n=1 Tax=Sabulicella glaciei TaxID=2984948 RepID=A0ABT3NSI2_9PROT|nr:thermonuclease family protein [Roseococcus sp. MDT2-1-1]MCW8085111.1 thermonuclease family protein [Roseococcus sp. MDT2-1-1]
MRRSGDPWLRLLRILTPRGMRGFLFPLILLGSALGAWLATQRPAPDSAFLSCAATDGDTLRCGEERVRLLGLDAPEMSGRCADESRRARAARDRLAALVQGGVRLARDGEDRYGRTLATAFDREGRDLTRILIREGHARPYDGRTRRQGWC